MTMCDGRVDVFDSGGGLKKTVTIDTDRHAEISAGMQGRPFQRALPAGELSADSRGSAVKSAFALLSQKVTKAAAGAAQGKDVI